MKRLFYSALWMLLVAIPACKPSYKVGELVGVDEKPHLEGISWQIAQYNGQPMDGGATLELRGDTKTIKAFAGCNDITGTYVLSGNKLTMTPVTGRTLCGKAGEFEVPFIDLLIQTNSYHVNEDKLFLKNGATVLAVFKRYYRTTY